MIEVAEKQLLNSGYKNTKLTTVTADPTWFERTAYADKPKRVDNSNEVKYLNTSLQPTTVQGEFLPFAEYSFDLVLELDAAHHAAKPSQMSKMRIIHLIK